MNKEQFDCIQNLEKESNMYVLKKEIKDGRTYISSDSRFNSYDDAYITLFNEGYHIEAKVAEIGQRKFNATKDGIEYEIGEVEEHRYFNDEET